MKTSSSNSTAGNTTSQETKNLKIMEQPALGIKISELRKSKGLTQEELVEQCNISVRTIQRIEAGEVTPRSYTIKTILSALDYDLEKIQTENSKVAKEFKKLFLLDIDDSKEASFLTRQLTISWISGIVYFILGFGEFALDYSRHFGSEMLVSTALYSVLKLVILVAIILFMRGFILSGKIFKNYLLRITAFIFTCMTIIFYTYDLISLHIGELDFTYIIGAQAVTFGVIGILLGISVIRLQNALGMLAKTTGIFEIIAYGCMATVILGFLGYFLLTPTIILEIILLYRISEMLKAKQQETDLA
ncbi:XRE family transcriptional regulator [Aquimarina sp. AD1]|uniref:helix-turn-helix domain-containing protein n=1 Tax=Aquimarina sp. (strain AD1) TaxID=1714848 RepID=UPI000E4855B1|nr:helix-turn-helix transcriptional regulator [Aquimarina sp. AD1]AXT57602.1 XRE family transcriptional regulator [Aquimarina sp. AD1]RKN13897.1 helix-turn-helix domain-containing protein [Aquimarina sp. AD1]